MAIPRKLDPCKMHNELLDAIQNGQNGKMIAILKDYLERECKANYGGKIYTAFLVGYSRDRVKHQFLIYSPDIDNGSDGLDGLDSTTLKCHGIGPVRGMYTNHVWASPAQDPFYLLKNDNSFYVVSDGHSRTVRRDQYLRVEVATYNGVLAEAQRRKITIDDMLFNVFCGEKSEVIRPAIRQLEID